MTKLSSAYFYSGLSGLQLNIPKYLFPEPFQNTSRLTYYASLFNSIEINRSFYKIPQQSTVSKWAASVGNEFRFTFKLWKEITHNKELDFNKEFVKQFFKSIDVAGEKGGCVLIQFPPGAGKEHFIKLKNLLSYIREIKTLDWKIAIEFRNKSWYNASTYDLLNYFNAALVIHDIPKSATPMINHDADFLYVRFHGPTGNYRDSYSEDFLMEYAGYVSEWRAENKTV
ncbi:MAG: DUF72 domain-containing protein, partial [Bacteroidota bacterium]